jgi:hypothetical protein
MEAEGSLQCSQKHATGPYLKTDKSILYTTPYNIFNINVNITFHQRLSLLSDLFPSGLSIKTLHALVLFPPVLE